MHPQDRSHCAFGGNSAIWPATRQASRTSDDPTGSLHIAACVEWVKEATAPAFTEQLNKRLPRGIALSIMMLSGQVAKRRRSLEKGTPQASGCFARHAGPGPRM